MRGAFILAVCLGFPGQAFAATYPIRFRAVPNPVRGLAPMEIEEPSSLPSGWKFWPMPAGNAGYQAPGPPVPTVTVNPTSGEVIETYREGDVRIGEPLAATTAEYAAILSDRTTRRLWAGATQSTRSVAKGTTKSGTTFRVELPVQLPKAVRSIVGDGAPNIEVQGSETISLGGTSNWTSSQHIQGEQKGQSAFPSLEMKQELNVNLTGSIGDKIKVDVDQSSNVVTAIDNQVKLRYEGDENDMIKSVELGNTNLSVEGASFRQEGLFGIKTVAKLGTVDVVAIASKQQGKTETARFTPSGSKTQVSIPDLAYIKRQYFLISNQYIKVDLSTLKVFKDNMIQSDNANGTNAATTGIARLDPTAPFDTTSSSPNPEFAGNFNQLTAGEDYDVINPWLVNNPSGLGIPVIRLKVALNETENLAVTYVDQSTGTNVQIGIPTTVGDPALGVPEGSLLLKMIRPSQDRLTPDAGGAIDTAGVWYPTLFYELRNFYDLGGRDIALETLDLSVRRIDSGQSVNPDNADGVPYLQMLGLDQQSQPGAVDESGPDGEVDPEFIDRATGILFFPDMHPYNPDATLGLNCAASSPVDSFGTSLCLDNFGRNKLRNGAPVATLANPNVYYTFRPNFTTDTRFYIDASYKSAQQGFSLNRFDILENSEQVRIDNIPAKRGVDYNIDYATGQITFIKAPGPDQSVTVDYSFAPGVGSTQLTLTGASASYVPNPNLSVTSSILYNSRGALEKNPKLGEEPAKSLITNLASVVQFRPVWMTQLANLVPGVRTNQPSTLNIQGNASMSMPNPNTVGVAYLDDMEGDRESYTVSVSRPQWIWSGYPVLPGGGLAVPPAVSDHAHLEWYNPAGNFSVHENELKPYLNDTEGKVTRPVLGINVRPPTGDSTVTTTDWSGLTQGLSTSGQDFSRFRFVEIWVNDFRADHSSRQGKLHIDLGHVTEDAFWSPFEVPNDKLDTEDKNFDGKLDINDNPTIMEDTGLDGLVDPEEPGYNAQTNPDPDQDDYHYSADRPNDYSKINNYENNGLGLPGARPDTEDLNRDGYPDFFNNYFEATLDLSSTARIDTTTGIEVVTDVPNDFPNDPDVKPGNGWRLFRIPITAEAFERIGTGASWQDIEHIRLWMDGMTDSLTMQIGGIEIVGNRWSPQPISAAQDSAGLIFTVGSLNNKDNVGYYIPPPIEIGNNVGTTTTKREQSLALTWKNLAYGDSVLAYKTSFDPNNGLGWTQYSQVLFWAHGDLLNFGKPVRVFARFGADTVNYYEYSAPLLTGWHDYSVAMAYLSQLKEMRGSARVFVDSTTYAGTTGEVFTVVGNPSFTRILRVSFGATLYNVNSPPSTDVSDGEVWIDELRLDGVKSDNGGRGDMIVQANFADLMGLNVNYSKQNENFVRVGSGQDQGTGVNSTSLGLSTTFQIDRMMPTSGVQLPLRYSVQHTTDVPKYQTGSDLILTPAMSSQETSETDRRTLDMTYRRTSASKGIAKYTLNALNAGMTYSKSNSINPSAIDSSVAFTSAMGYDLPLGGGGFSLGKKMKVNVIPDLVGLTMGWRSSRTASYARTLSDTSSADSSILRSNVMERFLTLGLSSTWTPLTSVRINLGGSSLRNMLLHQPGAFGFNKGTEVDQTRRMQLNYQPHWLPFFAPNLSMTGTYHQQSGPSVRRSSADPLGLMNVENHGIVRVTATIPLGRVARLATPRPGAKSSGGGGAGVILAPLKLIASRLQDIQGSFNIDRGTVMQRITGDPSLAFTTGFTSNPGTDVQAAANANLSSGRSYTSGANTTIRPTPNLTLDIRADQQLTYTEANLGARRINRVTLPDMKARWQNLEKVLGLRRSFASLQLNSGFNIRKDEQGPEGGLVEIQNQATTWAPLLGWDLVWKNGLRATINTAITKNKSIDSRIGNITSTRQTGATDIRFSKTYPASKGFRLPFSSHPIRLKNDLNLNLNFGVISNEQVTLRPGYPPAVEINNQQLNVKSTTNYNFTQAISGGFDLGFTQNKDFKSQITQRGITIAFNGQFRF